ncbi:hypothetical protein [Streptomyces purpureus]|uniref:CchlP n=1 Tax=Streptomyces purpureus TaxID=1951 RepID=A0A918LN51_9ACTN|nr:hypothetical protein [Streptomyces purpureus]GGT23926.1 hypothetical protein GCM10014713_16150 [Streptomyces purpureus]
MEAELVALATAGATALVQQMVGDGWGQVKGRVTAFFARRAGTDPEAVGEELETVRAELLTADESGDAQAVSEAQAEARTEWRARMRRTLRADPQAAAELRALLDELTPPTPGRETGLEVHNTMSGGVQHGTFIQAGTIGSVNHGAHGGS